MNSGAYWMRESFAALWMDVRDLSPTECDALLRTFMDQCVRVDLQRRFPEDFRGGCVRPRHFLHRPVTVSREDAIDTVFRKEAGKDLHLRGDIMWGTASALHFEGTIERPLGDLAVIDGDAICRLQVGTHQRWVFLPHDDEGLWLIHGER